jgi:PBP1b-binding outer membrane lipoprotein LpoB
MVEFVNQCVSGPAPYKAYSDKIVATFSKESKTPVKVLKSAIDRVKEIIKATPK